MHRFLVEGVPVEFYGDDGVLKGDQVRLIDFDDPDANDWLAVNQYTVIENKAQRRPDLVIFVNGLPLGIIELKNPGDENLTPWRNAKVSSVPSSLHDHPVARSGTTDVMLFCFAC